jgi:transcriptional regulator with XRE-family HTH domain
MIDAAQIRAARALLGVNQTKLSEWARISVATVKRIEAASEVRGAADTLWKIQSALEAAGVEFIAEDDAKGPGVRLKHRRRGKEVKRGPGRRKARDS